MTTQERVLTPGQRGALDAAGTNRNALVAAQDHLIHALGRPQPNRERKWAAKVQRDLQHARDVLSEYRAEVEGTEGLYAELQKDAPWVLPRVRQLRNQLERVEQEADHLVEEVTRVTDGDLQALPAIRADAERMLFLLRDLLSREADLIYEQFNEPGALD